MSQRLTTSSTDITPSFGAILKHWRDQRGYSQLDLATTSQVSQRHISFLESGRAKPSREMVLQLATVLEIPLRQQNLLLTAAGFAPSHAETDLSALEMLPVRRAINFLLRQQEPYPAIVIDRYWNLLLTNNATTRLLNLFVDPAELQNHFYRDGKINLMQIIFDPRGLRPFIANWEELSGHLLQRLHREVLAEGENEQSHRLLNELMSYPNAPDLKQPSIRAVPNTSLLTTHFRREHREWKFFSTIATLGTPYDITLQELRIECLFPADETTERNWKQLGNE